MMIRFRTFEPFLQTIVSPRAAEAGIRGSPPAAVEHPLWDHTQLTAQPGRILIRRECHQLTANDWMIRDFVMTRSAVDGSISRHLATFLADEINPYPYTHIHWMVYIDVRPLPVPSVTYTANDFHNTMESVLQESGAF